MVVIVTSPWIFLYFSPQTHQKRRLLTINTIVLATTFLACVVMAVWVRSVMIGGPESDWWPVVALTYGSLLMPVLLLTGGIIRNFLMF
jgi:hypothetical protein